MGLLDGYEGNLPDLLPDVGQQKLPDPAEQFKGGLRVAQTLKPDELAGDFQVGRKLGMAPDFVAAERQMARQRVVEDDAAKLFAGAPIARDFLAKKPTTLALAQDDLFNVAALEQLLNRNSMGEPDPVNQLTGLEWLWESAKRAIQVGDQQNQLNYLQMQPQTADVKEKIEVLKATMPKEPATKNWDELGLDLRSIKDALEMGWVEAMKMTPQRWEQLKSVGFYGAGGYIVGGIAGGLATGGLGIVPGANAGLAVGTGYGSYIASQKLEGGTAITEMDDFRDEDGKPLDPALKQMVGEGIGIINGGLELFQIKTALRAIPGGNKVLSFFTTDAVKAALKNQTVRTALTQVAKLYGTTVAKETAQELGQEFVTVMGGELAKMASDGEFAKITPDQFWQRMADTAYSSATAFMVMTAPGSSIQVVKDVKAARQAQLDANFFQALDDNVQASKLRERLPEAHAELVEAIRAQGGTPEAVYVEAAKLREAAGLEGETFNQLLTDIGVDPAEFTRAEQLQADVAIPFSQYATRVAGTALSQKLREDVKFQADGMSQRQAKEFEAGYQERVQAAMAEQQANQEQNDAALAQVVGEYKGELKRLGMSDADADASLRPLIKGASVAAARWTAIRGETVTPAQWLTEVRNLQVRAVDQPSVQSEDGTLNQDHPAMAGVDMNDAAQVAEAQRLWAEKGVESPYFKKWFGESKVVDAEGKPLVVYHGTKADFESFARSRGGEYGSGMYFTPDAGDSGMYADRAAGPDGQKLYPVYLSFKNPYYAKERETVRSLGVKKLQKMGYDGIIAEGPTGEKQYIAFDPTQIKSVFNRGTFDPNDPRILMQAQNVDEYAGDHRPPGPDNGAPLHDLTGGGNIYPDDVYSRDAVRYYGQGEEKLDRETISTAQRFRGKPEATVTIYRAVPDALDPVARLANLEKHKAYMLKNGKVPPGVETSLDRAGYYDKIYDEIESLRAQQPGEKISINPGDWVTINKNYAKQHGESTLRGEYTIISKKVKAKEIFTNGDSIHEWGYWPGGAYAKSGETLFQSAVGDRTWAKWEPERTQAGKIKGAPEWVQNDKDLATMRRTLRKFVQEGLVGRMWYENSAEAVVRMVGGDLKNAEKFIQLLAIYSPNSNVWVNTIQAVRAYTHWAAGGTAETMDVGSKIADAKAISVLYHDEAWSGRKTNSFYMNLMHDIVQKYPDEVKELNIDQDIINSANKPATIDVWMARAFGYEVEQFADDKGTGQYSFAENEVRRLTARLNMNLAPGQTPWTPHQVQAAVWTAVKTRYEIKEVKDKTNIKSEKQGLITRDENGLRVYPQNPEKRRKHLANWRHFAMQAASEEVINTAAENARSFGDDLQRMTNVVTWEAIPSPSFAADLLSAAPEIQQSFTAEARALLMDEYGNDLLALQLGVPLSYSANGFGAYSSAVSPNNLAHLLPARKKGQEGFSVDEVRAYARAIQYIFKQDAVPWFRPDNKPLTAVKALEDQKFRVVNKETGKVFPGGKFDTQAQAEEFAKKKGENAEVRGGTLARGMVLRYSKALDPDALQASLEALKGFLGEDAGFTRTADNEITVVNFRDDETKLPFARTDEEFIDAVERFAGEHRDAFGITDLARNWVEGEYGYVHDWKADPEGTVPLEGAAGGRPVLHSWLRGRRDAFNALLEQYSGERLARLEQGRTLFQSDAVRAGGPQRIRAGAYEVARRYGEPVEGAESVLGFHYSREPRESLSGFLYGNGIRGAEAKRLAYAEDTRLKQRVHFYVDTGSGITPEPGVGGSLHGIHLDNLYNAQADPLGLRREVLTRGLPQSDVANAFESAILDAGFDGIYVPQAMGEMGVAVLLGPAHTNVPVQQLEVIADTGEAMQAPAAPSAPQVSGRMVDDRVIYTDMDSGRVVGTATKDGAVEMRDGWAGKGFEEAIKQDMAARTFAQATMPSGVRGAITFGNNDTLIRLFKGSANFSTMLHETAHLFVNDMEAMVATGKAPEQVVKDLEAMKAYAGDLNTVDAQEKLARAFEAYLREGKAPSAEMRSAFQRFRAWLTAIYRDVKAQLGVELNDEIRGVFDRMLAAEDEIANAQAKYATEESVVFEMLTPAEQKRIQQLKGRSREEALEKRTQRYIAAYMKALGGKKAFEAEALKEVEAMPVYQTIATIAKEGGLPPVEVGERFGEDSRQELGLKFPGLIHPVDESVFGVADLDTVAVAYGYSKADEMIADFQMAKTKGQAVADLTAQKIQVEEAKLREQLAGESAEEEIHGEPALEKLVLEAKAIERKIASTEEAKRALNRGLNSVAMREVARGVLAEMPLAQAMRHDRHAAAERRAGIEAERAIKKGKWEEALAAKEREALNHALVLEAVKLREQVAKDIKRAMKIARSQSMDFTAKEHVLALVETYEMGSEKMAPMRPEELGTLADYFNTVYADDEFGMNPLQFFSPWVLNRENPGSYKNLTVNQFNELTAVIMALADAGGSEFARMVSETNKTRQEKIDELVAAIVQSGYSTKKFDKGTTAQRVTTAYRDVLASLQRMPDLFRNADGNVDATAKTAMKMGPNQQFAERIFRATTKMLEMLYAHKELKEIEAQKLDFAKRFKSRFGERTAQINGVAVSAVRQAEGMFTWTAESVWSLALNMGNEGNLRTLMAGDGFNEQQLGALTSILTSDDWRAIQQTWDIMGRYYDETDRVFRQVYGFPMPSRVVAQPLTVRTAEGTDLNLKGGYFPIKVDPEVNPDIGAKQEQDLLKGDPRNKFTPAVAKGHTKERTGTSRPVTLSYEVAHRALHDQAKFIALAPVIKDARAIFSNLQYRRAMVDAFGKDSFDEIMPWLKNIANPVIDRADSFDSWMNKLRHLSTLYILGLNIKSSTKQYLGLAGAANKLGARWVASGLAEMAKFGGMGVDFVNEQSAFMQNRDQGLSPELAEINAKARGRDFRVFGVKTGLSQKQAVDAVMVLTRLADRHVTYSVWLGAFKRGQAEGLGHQESVEFADRMVRRTQMSGSPVDVTGWQRDEGGKRFLTMFMSEAIPKSSRMRSDFNAYKNGKMSAAEYARSLFYESIAPAVGYTALMFLVGAASPRDWWKEMFWQLYNETIGTYPLLGSVSSALQYGQTEQGVPGLTGIELALKLTKNGGKLGGSSEDRARFYKALVDFLAYAHGVGNLRRIYETAAEGWKDIDHNKTANPFRLFFRKPKEK